MILRTLESRRLTLVAATAELVSADLDGRDVLAKNLSAHVPDSWPPTLFQRPAMSLALQQLMDDPHLAGWSFWYLLSRSEEPVELMGLCGFKGRPDPEGSVEISYSMLSQFQTMGFATEAVERLLVWAFSHHHVREVSAETLPHLRKSIRILEKNGFSLSGAGSEQGVIRYAVKKTERR